MITLATSPFVVVHVNLAFTLLTSQSSTKILGQPLHQLLEDPVIQAALQTSCERFSLRILQDQTIKVRALNRKDPTPCKVAVSTIGQDASSTTHYALELEDLGNHSDESSSSSQQEIRMEQASEVSTRVMG